ncbi:MAG: SagB/ThcOx family dehydrogenase [Planctomycetes bacterium]|jgi:SagB-type dehydrogenase family enzyme|nr:SagB/ThcOx family dehydrogenase [Planctomycetota bacterium]MCL4730713.1 SagB/ThcOx family dehydrogenase [Planctomycetota bacterium]
MAYAFEYHRRTKYSPSTLGQGHSIDWNNPPEQFKDYRGAPVYDMRPYLPTNQPESYSPERGLNDTEGPFSLPRLSMLLFGTNGVTGVAFAGDQQHFFRAAPSAGALYPTDLYLAVRGHADLPDGIYYYHVRDHSLVEVYPRGLAPSGDEIFARLRNACFGDGALADCRVALVATAVYWRSAWRYGERAYRRCLLDTGHVLGNLAIVAPKLGLCAGLIGGFVDGEVADLLAIPAGKEGVLAVCPIHEQSEFPQYRPGPTARPSPEPEPEPDADAIRAMHAAGSIPPGFPAEAVAGEGFDYPVNPKYEFAPGIKLKPGTTDMNDQIENAILRRRSTRVLSGAPLKLHELADLLAFAYRPDLTLAPDAQPRLFAPSLLETFVVVNTLEGVKPGVYHFAPGFMELLVVKQAEVRREIYHLSLGQELARDASVVVIHTSDMDQAARRFGSRAYRYLHLDAGHIGERMNVGAIRLGLGVSGIGGFFDDEVNELLGIPPKELCVYITCLGRPGG